MKTLKEIEKSIAQGMSEGNRKSYIEFVEKYSRPIYRECLKVSNDSDEADDHLNEILIRIVISIGQFDPDISSMLRWVLSVTRNYFRNYLRDQQLKPELVCYEEDALDLYVQRPFVTEEDNTDDEEDDENIPDLIKLRKALAGMSKRDRSILFYRADGFSYENIGEFLGIKSGTAMTAYSRAVRKIKDMFACEVNAYA
ncbi:MAG: RNA polymerase sigma factor [Spirochaetes bacterium]|nr:RNA polymerase sigma factor [Spirochaetota bacterium]